MKYNDFCTKVKKALSDYYGESASVELKNVIKNNGISRTGILVNRNKKNPVPTVYLEDLYTSYEDGMTFSSVIERLIELTAERSEMKEFDIDAFTDFEKAKDHILFKLINTSLNKELLKDIPSLPYLDMAVVFYYLLPENFCGNASILITKQHMNNWKTDTQTLYTLAYANQEKLLPRSIRSMRNVLKDVFKNDLRKMKGYEKCAGDEWLEELTDDMVDLGCTGDASRELYVVTNSVQYYGASAILNKEALEECEKICGGSFYILPSSVHELIVFSDMEMPASELYEMVKAVNDTQVAPEEILSYSVYRYDAEKHVVTRLEKCVNSASAEL